MNTLKALLVVAIMLLVSGCGTKVPFKAKEPLDGAALLYVYVVDKKSDTKNMSDSKYKLQINGKNVNGEINAGEYRVFDMKPATILVTSVRRNIERMHVKVNMQAGNIYYLKIESGNFGGLYNFNQVSSNEGKREISKSVLAGATGVDLTKYTPDFAGSTAGEDGKTMSVPAMSEAEINAIIEKKINERIANMPVQAAPVQAAPAAASVPTYVNTPKVSKMDEIQRAYDMKEKGMLTEEEFSTIKAEILAK